jgi:signal transduction histidine kinase
VHSVILAAVLGAVVFAVVHEFTVSYEQTASQGLVSELVSIGDAARSRPAAESVADFARRYLGSHALPAGGTAIVTLAGQSIYTAGSPVHDPAIARWLRRPPPATVAFATGVAGRPTEVAVSPLRIQGRDVGTMIVTASLAAYAQQAGRVRTLAIVEAVIALVAGVLSAFFLLRGLLRMVGRITSTAEGIGHGALATRLGDQGTDDEVGQLARTFDDMLDRLEGAMSAQRRLLSDVSHQLRTPMTVARGHLEILERTGIDDPAAVRGSIAIVVDEIEHMRTLTERLLFLGRAMEPDFLSLEDVDLRSLLADVHHAAGAIAPRKWSLTPVPDLVVRADESKLRGALLNLVQNAANATEPADNIVLSAARTPGGDLRISVDDSGPGIAPDRRVEVFGRFARPGAGSDGGCGLGLAIVLAVAEAHGGRVEVADSGLGGCRVSLFLPAGCVVPAGRLAGSA